MPIQTAEHWEEKARLADALAEGMGHDPAKIAMQEIARLYRQHGGKADRGAPGSIAGITFPPRSPADRPAVSAAVNSPRRHYAIGLPPRS
jgi:hypothetical protein